MKTYSNGDMNSPLSVVSLENLKRTLAAFITSAFLTACGGAGDSGEASNATDVTDICKQEVDGVNWQALLTENCANLSDYNLFQQANDPINNPNTGGVPYDLTVPLFTDYASKYRFVFVPNGQTVTYNEHEAFDFPVGSVLVKTFALPDNTAQRGDNESLIETRLLIHRADGWTALPYYWETEQDARLLVAGKTIQNVSLTHKGETLTFDYGIPQASQCTACHGVVPVLQGADDRRQSIFKPIGPKARFLNKDYEYPQHTMNQLAHWESEGILTGAPADKSTISTAPVFDDSTSISDLVAQNQLDLTARGYLDINCAHCHRSELTLPEPNYAGAAGDSGLTVEFNRDYEAAPARFGVCKTAVAGGSGDIDGDGQTDYPRDVIPGQADKSYLLFRMNTNDARHKMPELGRSSIHTEGVSLISAWIDALPANDCGL